MNVSSKLLAASKFIDFVDCVVLMGNNEGNTLKVFIRNQNFHQSIIKKTQWSWFNKTRPGLKVIITMIRNVDTLFCSYNM